MHDDYKPVDLSQFAFAPPNGGPALDPCPVCGSKAALWQYSESETAPRKLLVMCSHGERIGPQDGLIHEGCLLYMPGDNFYRETIRDAIRYWNEFSRAIVAMRSRGVEACRRCGVMPGEVHGTACLAERARGVAPSDDAQRLDWLQGFADVSLEAWFTGAAIERRVTRDGHTIGSGRTLREAIDAARTACPRGPADFPGSAAAGVEVPRGGEQ